MITALRLIEILGYAGLVAGFALWVLLSAGGRR